MACRGPSNPLLVVLGSTGTGKSELAVELATRFNGEIINADAVQLYRGLPILTNKISPAKQRGIPHHLLGHIAPGDPPWDVSVFMREATRTLAEIRARGKLPILVGGTHYYIDSMLFTDVLATEYHDGEYRPLPELDQPTEVLLRQLREYDPVMADRWHPNDRRKIQRSLEIFLRTGKPASKIYAEQQERKTEARTEDEPWEKLLFWVHSDRDVLCTRLESRVDNMVNTGLLDEVRELYAFKQQEIAQGRTVDMTKGIWQSIGYRQFEPYTAALCALESTVAQHAPLPETSTPQAEAPTLAQLRSQGIEDTKSATRRYAKSQTRWIRLKSVRRLALAGDAAVSSLYLVDSTDDANFASHVIEPAVNITRLFLAGEPRPNPSEISERAREVLAPSDPPPNSAICRRTCPTCGTFVITEDRWQLHIKSSAHKKRVNRAKKLALVPFVP